VGIPQQCGLASPGLAACYKRSALADPCGLEQAIDGRAFAAAVV
jgi:hypothetical protein